MCAGPTSEAEGGGGAGQPRNDGRFTPWHGRLTTSRTIVSPSRRTTSMPIGLGAGFAMAATKMAMEARMKGVVCMMDGFIGLEGWRIDGNCIWLC